LKLRAVLLAAVVAMLAAAPVAAWLASNSYLLSLATRAATLGIAAVSLQFVVGYGGMLSLGHAAFLGIGAYALLILGGFGLDDAAISLPAAIAAAALFAWPTGWVALRARGVGLLMITLAFGQMAYFAAGALAGYGGDDGMALARTPPLFGSGVLGRPTALHVVALAGLIGCVLGARRLAASRFGRALRAARDNPARAAALGYDVTRVRLTAYVLAGAVAGGAGWLLAIGSGFVSPATLDWRVAGELLVMVILGGPAAPEGAAIGAVLLVLAQEGLSVVTGHGRVWLGALFLVVALVRRRRRA
jgi:branched-chain amino acid transport system permease protein